MSDSLLPPPPPQPDLTTVLPHFDNGPVLWCDEGDRWCFHKRTAPLLKKGVLGPSATDPTVRYHLVAVKRYLRGPQGPGYDGAFFQSVALPDGRFVAMRGHEAHFSSLARALAWAQDIQARIGELGASVYQALTWEDAYTDDDIPGGAQ